MLVHLADVTDGAGACPEGKKKVGAMAEIPAINVSGESYKEKMKKVEKRPRTSRPSDNHTSDNLTSDNQTSISRQKVR